MRQDHKYDAHLITAKALTFNHLQRRLYQRWSVIAAVAAVADN